LLAGCGRGGGTTARGSDSTAPVSVPLIEDRYYHAVQSFVRLTLDGHPYHFGVDTGAADTLIDLRVARQLALRR
jgi:hypothetical protein